ncbi:MAG TPA: hypothetical protein VGA85_02825 [Dehalococcoidales bacterium]
MNIAEQVTDFLTRNRNQSFCDDCIREQVHLARRQQAQRVTEALATTPLFIRRVGECVSCHKTTKLVISTA